MLPPKRDTGIRTIGIDEETVRVLREHRERWRSWLGSRRREVAARLRLLALQRRSLVPYAPQSITKMFRTLAAGVPEVEVMGRHGHASSSSMKTHRHYIRVKDRMSTDGIVPFMASPGLAVVDLPPTASQRRESTLPERP
jgi:hypothetical protein